MTTITLRGREIPLLYTVYEMKLIQEEICPLGDIFYVLFGRNKSDEGDTGKYGSPEHLNALARTIAILGNGGLEESGGEPDLTYKWVMRSLKPGKLSEAMSACLQAMNEGMESEIPEEKPKGPVDVTLEEMNKKKERDG